MAASPQWKVYNAAQEYKAACKDVEDAACLVSLYGDGGTIRLDHKLILWTEGSEDQQASESYDHVAEVVYRRLSDGYRKTVRVSDPARDPRYGDPKRG